MQDYDACTGSISDMLDYAGEVRCQKRKYTRDKIHKREHNIQRSSTRAPSQDTPINDDDDDDDAHIVENTQIPKKEPGKTHERQL